VVGFVQNFANRPIRCEVIVQKLFSITVHPPCRILKFWVLVIRGPIGFANCPSPLQRMKYYQNGISLYFTEV